MSEGLTASPEAPRMEHKSVQTARSESILGTRSGRHSEDAPMETFCIDSQPTRRRNPGLRQWIAAIIVNMLYIPEATGFYAILHFTDHDKFLYFLRNIMVTTHVVGTYAFLFHSIILQFLNRKFDIIIICFAYYSTAVAIMYMDTYQPYDWWFVTCILWAIGSTGTKLLVPVYISETTIDHARGRLIAVKSLFPYMIHTLMYLDNSLVAYAWLIIAIATVVLGACLWLPETPVYLLRRRNVSATKQSLQRLYGYSEVELEVEKLWTILKVTHSDTSNIIATIRKFSNSRTLGYCGLAIMLGSLDFLSGFVLAVNNISFHICEEVRSTILRIILIVVIFTPGAITGLLVCDRFGYRKTLLVSIIVCSVALLLNGTWYWNSELFGGGKYIALLLAAVHFWGYSFGTSFLPTAITIDILPPNLLNIVLVTAGIVSWQILALPHAFKEDYEGNKMNVFLWTLSVVCAVSAPFFYFFLPETTYQHVGASLLGNRGVETTDPNNESPKSRKCYMSNSCTSDEA